MTVQSVLRIGMVACFAIILGACNTYGTGGGGSTGGGSGTGSWSMSTGSAADLWPPLRYDARPQPVTDRLSALAIGVLDALLNTQPAYAAGFSGGSWSSNLGSDGSWSGSYSSTGPNNCVMNLTVSGSFSGTSATMNMKGSGCGMTISGSGSGTMDVAWPNSTSFSGSYHVTVSGNFSGTFNGTVSGKKA